MTAADLVRAAIQREADRKAEVRRTRELILALPIPDDKKEAILVELDQNTER